MTSGILYGSKTNQGVGVQQHDDGLALLMQATKAVRFPRLLTVPHGLKSYIIRTNNLVWMHLFEYFRIIVTAVSPVLSDKIKMV